MQHEKSSPPAAFTRVFVLNVILNAWIGALLGVLLGLLASIVLLLLPPETQDAVRSCAALAFLIGMPVMALICMFRGPRG